MQVNQRLFIHKKADVIKTSHAFKMHKEIIHLVRHYNKMGILLVEYLRIDSAIISSLNLED